MRGLKILPGDMVVTTQQLSTSCAYVDGWYVWSFLDEGSWLFIVSVQERNVVALHGRGLITLENANNSMFAQMKTGRHPKAPPRRFHAYPDRSGP